MLAGGGVAAQGEAVTSDQPSQSAARMPLHRVRQIAHPQCIDSCGSSSRRDRQFPHGYGCAAESDGTCTEGIGQCGHCKIAHPQCIDSCSSSSRRDRQFPAMAVAAAAAKSDGTCTE